MSQFVMYQEGPEYAVKLMRESRETYGGTRRTAGPHEVTAEAVADMMDLDHEAMNAHDFVMCHRALAAMLAQMYGRDVATAVMVRLSDFDGLAGLTGSCGVGDEKIAQKELGVNLSGWTKWTLPEMRSAEN